MMGKNTKWWGTHRLKDNDTLVWSIGERFIALQKKQQEWTIWNKQTRHEEEHSIALTKRIEKTKLVDTDSTRFFLPKGVDSVLVEPSLADRAMIVKPSTPLLITPGEQITVYVSTPLWMSILFEEKDLPILDVPFWRPSDSWFGPNTMLGDICYAKYTDASMHVDASKPRSHRALTCVHIKNAQEGSLSIERLNLPVPNLRVYVDKFGQFWSEDLHIEQQIEHGVQVSLITQNAPQHAQDVTQISQSRLQSSKNSILSTLRNLVG